MNAAQQRKAQRIAHLVAAVPLLAFIYGPDIDALEVVVRAGVLPVLVLTGLLMWQAPRIRRFRQRNRPTTSASATMTLVATTS